MDIVCSDLEGIFTPEIWINFAEITGIEELRLTTRDISDYNVLMRRRLSILDENNLKLSDIQAVIAKMEPLEGALELLDWLRSMMQVIIVSDTYVEFAGPLMEKLGRPTLFCNTLNIAADGSIGGYNLRQPDGKKKVALALKTLNYKVIAIGDSYNDITMLKAADHAILYRPPQNVKKEYAEFPAVFNYTELKQRLLELIERKK
ncbi:MAG: bifunctional phosphoserine phosphatase/homoserine phosphotransferase ThrH [Desulfobacteraceae bacterium]|jgi:phosphoserine/homoserine phosphotransferase|nr:bifunctional phosphoserine phosphatase/homoserine phosphotransferase ThrH [Desulfobacteraceae bacterium]